MNGLEGLGYHNAPMSDENMMKIIGVENDYFKDDVYKTLVGNNYVFINRIGVTNFFLDAKLADNISTLIKI